jgi:hypothetical protein
VAKTAGAKTATVNKIDAPSMVIEGARGYRSEDCGCTLFISYIGSPGIPVAGCPNTWTIYGEDQDLTEESLCTTSTCIKWTSLGRLSLPNRQVHRKTADAT